MEDPATDTAISFEMTPRLPPFGHCISVRITAENAEAGFKPTSGGIGEEKPTRPHLMTREAIGRLQHGMDGYIINEETIQAVMKGLRSAVSDPSLPVYEINENLSPLSGRIDVNLFFGLSNMIIEFQKVCEGVPPQDHIGQR